MKIKLFVVVVVMILNSYVFINAQSRKIEAIKEESSITYKLKHPLHEVEAVSKESQCVVEVDPSIKKIYAAAVRVDVMSFNSGNSNRDSHAMEVIDALTYPQVVFTSDSITQNNDSLKITGKLVFKGITKEITIGAVSKWQTDKLEVDGNFDISLTEFYIERPSLLLIPVEDTLKFSFKEIFNL
ncbi:MAG: YceI family protein [Ignavibacteriaceae bacterium]